MNHNLVIYRTSDKPHNQYAVVPLNYLQDLLDWLKLSECAEVVSVVKDTVYGLSDEPLKVPINWPSYGRCVRYCETVTLLETR